jgi:hypothetical protein
LLDHADGLKPGAILARRLDTNALQITGDPVCCQLANFRSWTAALESII